MNLQISQLQDPVAFPDYVLVPQWAAGDAGAYDILFVRHDRYQDADQSVKYQRFFHHCLTLTKRDRSRADELSIDTWAALDEQLRGLGVTSDEHWGELVASKKVPKYFYSETFYKAGLYPWLCTAARFIYFAELRKNSIKPAKAASGEDDSPDVANAEGNTGNASASSGAGRQPRLVSLEVEAGGGTFNVDVIEDDAGYYLPPVTTIIAGKNYELALPIAMNPLSIVRAITLQQQIVNLRQNYRDAFVLINLEYMSQQEVSRLCHISMPTVATVENNNKRAKEWLRINLPDDFLEGFPLSVREKPGKADDEKEGKKS